MISCPIISDDGIVVEGRLDPLSKQSLVLYALIVMTALCSFSGGYDSSVMTGINGMQPFKDRFNAGNSAHATGIIFSLYAVGQMSGALGGSVICDRLGRRAAMFAGSIIIILASTILTASRTRDQFLPGRFLLGVGVSFTEISAPTYSWQSLIVPLVEGSHDGFLPNVSALLRSGPLALPGHVLSGSIVGYVIAGSIVWGTSTMTTDWSWRIPLIIQIAPASIVASVVWFCDPNDAMVALEITEFKSKLNVGNIHQVLAFICPQVFYKYSNRNSCYDQRWWDFGPLFKTRNARWRSLMVIMMALFVQCSGSALGVYNFQIFQALGFNCAFPIYLHYIPFKSIKSEIAIRNEHGYHLYRLYYCIYLGRSGGRKLLVYGTLGCTISLALNAGFSAQWASYGDGPKDSRVGNAAAAAFFLFIAIFSFTYAPSQSLYCVECLETTARAKGMTLRTFITNVGNFITLYTTPIGLENLQWRFILVFVFVDLTETILWYFLCVETVGRTLEELDDIFNEKYPAKASLFKKKVMPFLIADYNATS
ncbi:general substrate transporter [Hysterangium stoloniferum]|nr:general substrate transporter [Hysterangium stoloniferum]